MPATKSLRSGTCASTLFATNRSAVTPSFARRGRELETEELDEGVDTAFDCLLRDIRRGFDAEHRNAKLEEVLQEVPVVARDFDHLRLVAEAESIDDQVDVPSRVIEPRIRKGREIGVLTKDLSGSDVLGELNQETLITDESVERVERFRLVTVLPRDVALTQW